MSKSKVIFYSIFGAFHIMLFFLSLYIEGKQDDISFLFELRTKIVYMKYISIIGLILMVSNVIIVMVEKRTIDKDIEAMKKEVNLYKAKLYDVQEAQKTPIVDRDDADDKI